PETESKGKESSGAVKPVGATAVGALKDAVGANTNTSVVASKNAIANANAAAASNDATANGNPLSNNTMANGNSAGESDTITANSTIAGKASEKLDQIVTDPSSPKEQTNADGTIKQQPESDQFSVHKLKPLSADGAPAVHSGEKRPAVPDSIAPDTPPIP